MGIQTANGPVGRACSRRAFMKGAATGMAAIGGLSLFGCSSDEGRQPAAEAQSWDKEADVVVIGYGFAGACAAIAAQDAGASVIVVEKAPQGGGNSAASVGGVHTCIKLDDVQGFTESRIRGIQGMVPDDVIRAFVASEQEIPSWLEDDLGMEVVWVKKGDAYGSQIAMIAKDAGTGNGQDLFNFLSEAAESRGSIEVLLSTAATKLVQDFPSKEIRGVQVESDGAVQMVKARKGVILACGGYENNQELQAQFHYPGIKFLPWGTPYNTGDGIRMAGEIGASMWHFSCFEYAGITPTKAYEALEDHPVFSVLYENPSFYGAETGGSFLMVNRAGNRFMDEHQNIAHQKSTLPFNFYDEPSEDYVNYPFFFVFDEAMAKAGPIASVPVYNKNTLTWAAKSDYTWSADNSVEVEKGWVEKADTLEELASALGVDPVGLVASVEAFNACADGAEEDAFGRPTETMRALGGPFYAVECSLSIINTMGGPQRNEHGQTLDYNGQPIPRLYNVGELGSLNGGVLYSLGNISEAITSGKLSGEHAAGLEAWDDEQKD